MGFVVAVITCCVLFEVLFEIWPLFHTFVQSIVKCEQQADCPECPTCEQQDCPPCPRADKKPGNKPGDTPGDKPGDKKKPDESGGDKPPSTVDTLTALSTVQTEAGGLFVIESPSDWTSKKSAVEAALTLHANTTDNSVMQRPITVAFMDGEYDVGSLNMTYFTAFIGLGDGVKLSGYIHVEGYTTSISNVFFRSLTNLKLQSSILFGSSQMCPIRCCKINGNCDLSHNQRNINEWGSGGFMADTTVSGKVSLTGAQQFGFKNVEIGSFVDGQMNAIFVGSKIGGSAPGATCKPESVAMTVGVPSKVHGTDFATKVCPKITSTKIGSYAVLVKGKSVPATYIRTTEELQKHAFTKGEAVLLAPGMYVTTSPVTVKINAANVCIMGFGWSVLYGINLQVDAPGCTLASMVIDAAPLAMKQAFGVSVTSRGSNAEIYDVCVRTTLGPGGPHSVYAGEVGMKTMFAIAGAKTYMENVWLWRGDHWNHYENTPVAAHATASAAPKPCLDECMLTNKDCNRNLQQNKAGTGGSPQNCGSSCDADSSCYYWKQRGGWCGLYAKDQNGAGLDKAMPNFGFDDCVADPAGGDVLTVGISSRVPHAECCKFPRIAGSGGGGAGCSNGAEWLCESGTGATGWASAYDPLTKSGESNQNSIGLHVTGDDCVGLGLFVEHQTLYPILWEGNRGTVVFTQGETAYHDNVPKWDTSNIISAYQPGVYFTLGPKCSDFYYNGGGIYAIFAPVTATHAGMGVYAKDTSKITVTNLVLGAWVGGQMTNTIYIDGTFQGGRISDKKRFCALKDMY